MAGRVSARLTAAEGRKFGFTVGSAFLVLALVLHYWRHAVVAPRVFGVIAIMLLIGALLVPTSLGPIQRAWMGLAHMISKVTTPIFMGIIYFLVLAPVGVVRRALGKNSLEHEADSSAGVGFWVVRQEGKRRGDLGRQF